MTKKCVGCGVVLQNDNKDNLGYTPELTNDYCMRCFKLNNYGKEILANYKIDNKEIINRINAKKVFTLFVTDFLNISNFVLKKFKAITNEKALVISKKDLFPKNISIEKFLKNVKEYYHIKEDVYFVSVDENLSSFYQNISKYNNILVTGYTSAGKSSLINKLMGSNILESIKESTTLDFIEVKNEECTMIDSPGFVYELDFPNCEAKKRINPNIKSIKNDQEIVIGNVAIKSNVNNNLIFYLPNNIDIIKHKRDINYANRINIPQNSDLVILGMGFINIKNNCFLTTNMNLELLEVRDSLVGANHE